MVEILRENESHKFKNYLESACPRVSIEADKGINHFQLVSFIFNNFALHKETITDLITIENEKKVLKMIDSEFRIYFVPDRLTITKLILKKRFEKLLVFLKREQDVATVQKKINDEVNQKISTLQREFFLKEQFRSALRLKS